MIFGPFGKWFFPVDIHQGATRLSVYFKQACPDAIATQELDTLQKIFRAYDAKVFNREAILHMDGSVDHTAKIQELSDHYGCEVLRNGNAYSIVTSFECK